MRLLSFIFIYILSATCILAQQRSHPSLVIGLGGTSYRGDLSNRYESWGGTFHAGLIFNKKKRVNGFIHLMIGGVRGSNDSYEFNSAQNVNPNTYFKTTFIGLGYELRINVLKKQFYSIYISPGISLFRFDCKNEYNQSFSNQFLTRANGETYSNVTLLLPIKIGASYYLKNGFGIGADLGFLNPMSDYIDNISALGNRKKKDNLAQMNVLLYIPIK